MWFRKKWWKYDQKFVIHKFASTNRYGTLNSTLIDIIYIQEKKIMITVWMLLSLPSQFIYFYFVFVLFLFLFQYIPYTPRASDHLRHFNCHFYCPNARPVLSGGRAERLTIKCNVCTHRIIIIHTFKNSMTYASGGNYSLWEWYTLLHTWQ